jgi:hypothetical protein
MRAKGAAHVERQALLAAAIAALITVRIAERDNRSAVAGPAFAVGAARRDERDQHEAHYANRHGKGAGRHHASYVGSAALDGSGALLKKQSPKTRYNVARRYGVAAGAAAVVASGRASTSVMFTPTSWRPPKAVPAWRCVTRSPSVV